MTRDDAEYQQMLEQITRVQTRCTELLGVARTTEMHRRSMYRLNESLERENAELRAALRRCDPVRMAVGVASVGAADVVAAGGDDDSTYCGAI